ncbi:MAG: MCP four helix bundle domain-containing protein [Candidatus Cloacimonetes bacterium]|nr:MCP four helix bundle domain-containing protein [Candidatus Cloacimonadota bacterium]
MKITVSKKLTISFFSIIILLFIASIVSMGQMVNSSKILNRIIEQKTITLLILDIRTNLTDKREALMNIILLGQNDNLFEKYLNTFNKQSTIIENKISNLKSTIKTTSFYKDVIEECNNFSDYYDAEDELMKKTLNTYRAKGKKAASALIKDQLNESGKHLDNAINILKMKSVEDLIKSEKKSSRTFIILLFFFIISIIAAVVISSLVSNRMVSNIVYLTNAANDISLGSMDIPIEARSHDELGKLAEVFESMRREIKGAMHKLRRR